MSPERPDKKSDTIKFRVPWSLKRDFMQRARQEGRPASDIFRDLMEDYLRRPAQRATTQTLETAMTTVRRHPRRSGFAAVLGAAGISALIAGAIPAGAAAPPIEAGFAALDTDGDGVLTHAELARMMIGGPRMVRVDAATGEQYAGWPMGEVGFRGFGVLYGEGAAIARSPQEPDLNGRTDLTNFDSSDRDKNGQLSIDEFEARFANFTNRAFVTLDKNGDGYVAETETSQAGKLLVVSLDSNGDDQVSREEFSLALVLGFGLLP